MQRAAVADPLEDAIRQADALLQAPANVARDPLEEAIHAADSVLQAAPPKTTTIISGAPAAYGLAATSGDFSPLELETIGRSPATQATQTPASAFDLPRVLPPFEGPRVSAAPAKAPMPVQPRAPLRGATQGGEAVYGKPPPIGAVPILDAPAVGVQQLVRGLKAGAEQSATRAAQPLVEHPAPPHTLFESPNPADRVPRGATPVAGGGYLAKPDRTATERDAEFGASSDIIEGVFKTIEPLVVGAGIATPVRTAITLAVAAASQRAGEKAADLAGASPEEQRLAGNVAAVAGGAAAGSDQIRRAGRAALTKAVEVTDPLAAAARARRSGIIEPDANVIDTEAVKPPPPQLPAAATEPPPAPPRVSEPSGPPPQPVQESPAPAAEPAMDVQAALRDYWASEPNSPEARTAFAALERAGVSNADIQAAAPAQTPAGATPPSLDDAIAQADTVLAEDPLAAAMAQADAVLQEAGPDAAEKPSATPVDVGEPSGDGAPVGDRNAEGQPPAGTGQPETALEPRPPEPLRPAVAEAPVAAPAADPLERAITQADSVLQPRAEPREFASTQIDLPPDVGERLQAVGRRIPQADLAPDGRETEPHITLKFGLHENDPEAVRRVLAGEPPIRVTLGKTSIFSNGESNVGDVVKVDVDSPDLHRLNQKIAAALPNTDTHPAYQPHATIAYVKAGRGQQYADDHSLEGQSFTVDRVTFSGKHGELVDVPLTGAPAAASRTVQTPAAASQLVTQQLERVVDTKGASSAADVQRRVLAVLAEELQASEAAAGFKDLTYQKRGGGEGLVLVDGAPITGHDKHGRMRWWAPFDGLDKAVYEREMTTAGDRDSTPSERARAAMTATAAEISRGRGAGQLTVKIPGDGTFTIERNPHAIRAVMEKIRTAGTAVWRDRAVVAAAAGQPAPAPPPAARGRFISAYTVTLREAREARPSAYSWPESQIPQLADKMATALASGTGDVSGAPLKAAAKRLGVKPTVAGWKAYFASSPASTPAAKPAAPASAADVLHESRTSAPRRSAPASQPAKPEATAAPEAGGTTLDLNVVPGGRQFVERDVVPTIKKLFDQLLAQRDATKAALAPERVSTAGSIAGGVVRAHKALEVAQIVKTARMLADLQTQWDRVPREQQLAFAMAVDEGDIGSLPSWQRGAARLFSEINAVYRAEVQRRGGFRHGFIDDYYPREWDRPGKVKSFVRGVLSGKRPFKGRQGFRKQRARKESGQAFTFAEMYDAGFRPVAYNPVEAHLRKWAEMRKWISAYDILREHKDLGVAKFVRIGGSPPADWRRYPESYATVYGKPSVEIKEAFDPQLRAGLQGLIDALGVVHKREVSVGGRRRWGWARGDREMATKFGGPEGVIMHELGHILDARFGLASTIGTSLDEEARSEKDFGEKTWAKKELAALADLRAEGQPSVSPGYRAYLRKGPEKIANLVHAFLYAPERAKAIAPNSYWALYNLAKDTPELRPLLTLQKTRGLGLGVDKRDVRVPGLVISGYYYGPDDAVRIMERYLSPGLSGSQAFRAFRVVGNGLNQVQLGFSFFHFMTTGLEAIISKSALGLERLSRGDVGKGLADIAVSPVAPLLSLWKGSKALQALRAGDPSAQRFDDLASQIIQGGGREGWDPFWHNETAVAKWAQSWRGVVAEAKAGNYPGAAARTVGGVVRSFAAAIELQAKPVMEWWVPRMKLAAFADLARLELDDLGDIPDLVEGRRALAAAWDSVDNRFGELIYDNLFWDRRLKDFAMAVWRAPGWNLGTVREVFLAVPEQAGHLAALAGAGGGGGLPPTRVRHTGYDEGPNGERGRPHYEEGRAPALTHKGAYFLSFLFWVSVFGAVVQYLHTGLKPGEQEDGSINASEVPLDLFFPRREKTEQNHWDRVVLPSYMRDLYAALHQFPHGLVTMAQHKVHPLWTLAAEFLGNEDAFGNAWRDPEDPLATQVKDALTFLAEALQPLSVRNVQRGGHPVESALGLSEAPAYVTRSTLENYLREQSPPAEHTKEEAAAAKARHEIRTEARTDRGTAREDARGAVQAGTLTLRQGQQALKTSTTPGIVLGFQRLDLPHALHAYELATPEERRVLRPYLARKADNAPAMAPERRAALRSRLQSALQLPTTKAPTPVRAK